MKLLQPSPFSGIQLRCWLRFVAVNALLIGALLWLVVPGRESSAWWWPAYLILLLVLCAQYPLLRCRSWPAKILVFLSGMVVFLLLLGLVLSWNVAVGASAAGSWLARLDGAFRILLFGSIFGGWLAPLVIGVNWLLRRQLFPDCATSGAAGG